MDYYNESILLALIATMEKSLKVDIKKINTSGRLIPQEVSSLVYVLKLIWTN